MTRYYWLCFFWGGVGQHCAWHAACGSYFSDQGSNPCPLQQKNGVLTTGRPGKPQIITVLQTERAQRGQWLAEGQVHKLDHYKARIYLQASQVTYLPKRAMWEQRKRHLCGRVGGQRGETPGGCLREQVRFGHGIIRACSEEQGAFWTTISEGSQFPVQKWLSSENCVDFISGILMAKPGFCCLLWKHWEYPKFAVWFLSITLTWDTSTEAWEGGALSFSFNHVPTIFVLLSKLLSLYRVLATVALLHFSKSWLLVNGSCVEQRSVCFISLS